LDPYQALGDGTGEVLGNDVGEVLGPTLGRAEGLLLGLCDDDGSCDDYGIELGQLLAQSPSHVSSSSPHDLSHLSSPHIRIMQSIRYAHESE